MVKRVCVIGAGPAGLASLRRLTENHGEFDVVAFEQTAEVGGTWVYNENDGTDEHGRPVYSAMYPDLVTNFPTLLMEFPGFPYPEQLPSFVHNTHVRKYFEDFCQKLSLKKYIQFESRVVEVKPIEESNHGSHTWEVKVQSMAVCNDIAVDLKTYYFDAVMVCNGKYSVPRWPSLKGLELFTGSVRHSRTYRHPEEYTGKRVAVIGNGASAMDIAPSLTFHAKHVYHCRERHRTRLWPLLVADNLSTCSGIKEVKARTIVLEDGEEIEVDAVLICTGFLFAFPFLTPECRPKIEHNRVCSLYKHVMHVEHPTLGFFSTHGIPLADLQVRFFLASLREKMVLPSKKEMELDAEEDDKRSHDPGTATNSYHMLYPPRMGWYIQDVATLANITPVPSYVEKMYRHILKAYSTDYASVKNTHYTKIDDETFTTSPEMDSHQTLG